MKKILIIGIILISIIIFIAFMICYTNNNVRDKDGMENEKIDTQNIKKDKSKDLIYTAEYSVKGLEKAWYYCDTLDEERSLSDIKVPYINIDSEDAKNANAELNKLFEETAGYFKEEYDKTYNTNGRI